MTILFQQYNYNCNTIRFHRPSCDMLLFASSNFSLGSASNFLCSVFLLFPLFSWLSFLLKQSQPCQTIFWFILFQEIKRIIYQSKTCSFSTTKCCTKTIAHNTICSSFVHTCKFFSDVTLRNCSFARMKNINDHLSSHQQPVGHELACSDGCSITHFVLMP